MKKCGIILSTVFALILASCGSTNNSGVDKNLTAGIQAWNSREPKAATAYWNEISDENTKTKYLAYVNSYEKGAEALESTENVKVESKLLSACNSALDNFEKIEDEQLKLPADVCETGAELSAARVDKLLASGKITASRTLVSRATKVYGSNDALKNAENEIEVVSAINTKTSNLSAQGDKALAVSGFDERIAALDTALANYSSAESTLNADAGKKGVSSKSAVSSNLKKLKNDRQNLAVQREGFIREKAYEYKDKFGEEFARQPSGTGSGKNGAFTLYEIRNHYNTVQANLDTIYGELQSFAAKYPKEIGADVMNDIDAQRKDLKSRIAQINREIANKEEIESRGKTVMPLMIGLFNPAPASKSEGKKSRPAKFSAKGVKDDDYWWGMVSIPKGEMNDLVITLKDSRTVRAYAQNTHSGKDIKKKNLEDLISKSNKIGNSWPVMNAGSKFTSGNYYFVVEGDKNKQNYEGDVVVYSSFIVRMR